MSARLTAEDSLVLAQLAELTQRLTSQTETTERLANGIINHVLFAGTVTLPAADPTGVSYVPFQYGATCGSVEITNSGTNLVTVLASVHSGVVPTTGTGVHQVKPGRWRVLNIGSRFFTVYGTAGDVVGVQAFTVGGQFGAGIA
jgi:hypothetical protein